MAPGATGDSSFKRFRRGASGRLVEGLLSSNGIVAGVALATALLTLGFAVWFGVELTRLSRVEAPFARAAAVMNASINASLAALRGWVAYGQSHFVVERSKVWDEGIEPTLERLDDLASSSGDPAAIQAVGEMRQRLRELAVIQWAIEDVAQTPGNQPAVVAYERRLRPLRASVLRGMRSASDRYTAAGEARALEFLMRLSHFRDAFARSGVEMADYLVDRDESRESAMEGHLARARLRASEIRSELAGIEDADLRRVLAFALDEFRAYDLQVREIVALRRSSETIARALYIEEALPLVVRAREISGHLAETQAQAMEGSSILMTRASYALMGMALLMGLLSGGSLFVSLRLRSQVQNVLAKVERLGQYEIEKRIGEGGMGDVYLARHALLRRPTAIKLLRSEDARDARAQNRFRREVQLTCQLTHPNTIEIFDYGRTPAGIFYYAMEYVDGFSLEALVSLAGPVPPSRVIHMLLQACGSLQEAHHLGLLHRDIKPSNIMLTQRGGVFDTVKILDFGLVRDLSGSGDSEEDEDDMIAGTPMYLAPESILSAQSASPQSDIYALGAVAYFLLSGTTVFPSTGVVEILAHQLHDEVPFPSARLGSALPEDLEYVVMSCLEKDPADRPESAAKLASLLCACEPPEWTQESARLWWEEYGEAARNHVVNTPPSGTDGHSAPAVVVAASRG
jgi:serine/threonine protein kinase